MSLGVGPWVGLPSGHVVHRGGVVLRMWSLEGVWSLGYGPKWVHRY